MLKFVFIDFITIFPHCTVRRIRSASQFPYICFKLIYLLTYLLVDLSVPDHRVLDDSWGGRGNVNCGARWGRGEGHRPDHRMRHDRGCHQPRIGVHGRIVQVRHRVQGARRGQHHQFTDGEGLGRDEGLGLLHGGAKRLLELLGGDLVVE